MKCDYKYHHVALNVLNCKKLSVPQVDRCSLHFPGEACFGPPVLQESESDTTDVGVRIISEEILRFDSVLVLS